MFEIAVDKELALVFEFGIDPSALDDLALELLVAELEYDVGVHGEAGCFMVDVSLDDRHFEHSEDSVSFGWHRDVGS